MDHGTPRQPIKTAPGTAGEPATKPPSSTAPVPVPIELHELLGIGKHELPLICPHCLKEVHQVVWRTFGAPGAAALVGCGNCRKVLGAHLLGQLIY